MSLLVGTRRALLGGRVAVPQPFMDNLVMWLSADVGVFQDAAMTNPAVADGDVVGGWQDRSGNGNDGTNSTTAQKPELKLNIVNGLPVLRFDGSDDWLALPDIITGATNRTLFVVLSQTSGNTGHFFSLGANANGEAWRLRPSSAPNDTKLRIEIQGSGYDSSLVFIPGPSLIMAKLDGNTLGDNTVYVDDGAGESAVGAGVIDTGTGSSSIGQQNRTGTVYAQVDIPEILLYDAALSDANRLVTMTYANSRYGLW